MAQLTSSRRTFLGVAGLAGLGAAAPAPGSSDEADLGVIEGTLERYAGFGVKASGGPGDQACGAWLEAELASRGYVPRRQLFEAPFFEPLQVRLTCGDAAATLVPQAIVAFTGAEGLTAPLRLASEPGDLSGAIALIVLPYSRWITLLQPEIAQSLTDARRRGAAAAVIVTTGPTREAVALNVSADGSGFDRPTAILAPKDAEPFIAAARAGRTGNLILTGRGGRRGAFNLIARRDRAAPKTLILSTPRSGWFSCAAERGSGLAVWLWLAEWLATAEGDVNVELVATSGHEYQFLGGELYLAQAAPSPDRTRLWVHIGASAAARDWQEFGPRLLPLPSADAQRFLTATADLLESTRRAFKGITGLEATYLADKVMAGGELTNVLHAGYRSAIGLYGVHRYFHTQDDDLRCVSGDLVLPVARAFQTAILAALSTSSEG